jgi:hypothetical protein
MVEQRTSIRITVIWSHAIENVPPTIEGAKMQTPNTRYIEARQEQAVQPRQSG